MVVPDLTVPSQRYFERGGGRQVLFAKSAAEPTASDDPVRSAFIDDLLAKLAAKANG
jgi:hypothetical protein